MDLSIIIPAFNESSKIRSDIEAASAFLTEQGLNGQIIVVDDGSRDDTVSVAEQTRVDSAHTKEVLHYTPNRGKGYAVKKGVESSKGRFVMFADSGLCVPYSEARKGLSLIQNYDYDLAHGSRRHKESDIKRSAGFLRRMLSRLFRQVVYLFLGIPRHFQDTQCGFKMYKGDVARELYGLCFTEGFLFDIEILLRALKKGYRVTEFPIQWNSDPDSRVLPHHTALSVLGEMIQIKRKLKGPSARQKTA